MDKINKILKLHSIETKRERGRLYALEVWTNSDGSSDEQWIDCTGWTTRQVYDWLGY